MYNDNLEKLREIWFDLKDSWELHGWKVVINPRYRSTLGRCDWKTKTLYIAKWVLDESLDEAIETLLHEIAHAKAGPKNGHNRIWRVWCNRVGAKPVRCADVGISNKSPARTTPPKWLLVCMDCDQTWSRRRRTHRTYRHNECRNAIGKGEIRWVENPARETITDDVSVPNYENMETV